MNPLQLNVTRMCRFGPIVFDARKNSSDAENYYKVSEEPVNSFHIESLLGTPFVFIQAESSSNAQYRHN